MPVDVIMRRLAGDYRKKTTRFPLPFLVIDVTLMSLQRAREL
jgi:hypothetical protein